MDYITIIQGDDTNFLGDQFLVINFNTDIDLSGFTATFSLGNVTLTYGDLSGKNFEVILSDEITSNLTLGKQYGELKLIDTEKRIRTVTSVIPFLVRKGVNEEIKFVNNSLEVSMNINDTVLDVVIETPGIARAEATRMMSYCNEAKLSAQNSANEAQNTLIQLNQDVDIFYENISNLNDIVSNAYDTCENNIEALNNTKASVIDEVETLGNEKIALATKQADIATEKTQEVSDKHIQALSDIDTAKQDSLTEMQEKTVDSINEINTTTIAGKESLTEIANENLYKWNLFDIVKKDHILTFDEKQGLELLGNYVYKSPVIGERYGYPDFYEKCIEEYNDSTVYAIKYFINAVGSLTLSNGIIGGFTKGAYFKSDKLFSPQGYSWQIVRKIQTGSLGTIQGIFHSETSQLNIALKINTDGKLHLWLSSNGTSWNIASQAISTLTLNANTDYLLSFVFDGNKYILSFVEYVDENTSLDNASIYITIENSTPIISNIPFTEGNGYNASEPFTGSFDLKHCYNIVNGEIVWKGILEGAKHQNGHIYYDISQKNYIDDIYSELKIAWFYGLDTENERVFLPRNDYFFQNGNQENVGNFVEAGLPDHNHNVVAFYWNYPGVAEEGRGSPDYGNHLSLTTTNASQSNPIYGNSDTVQPPSTKLAVYMVVGNTVQKEAITNIIETTTSENDTIPLGYAHYDTLNFNHISWLKSTGQVNDGLVYKTIYNALIKALDNENPFNFKVIESNNIDPLEDYSLYWIIDRDNQTFICPTKTDANTDNNNKFLYFKVANAVENLEIFNAGAISESISNIISNNKEKILEYSMPDWDAATTMALNVDNIISMKGWILMRNTVYTTSLSGYINGRMVFRQYGNAGHWEEYNSLSFMVDVNDVVKLTGGELLFIPCKGVSNA
jgi:hypothetical protein